MSNIEKCNDNIEKRVFNIITERLIKKWVIENKNYFEIIDIYKNNTVFAFKNRKTQNILWYYDIKWKPILLVFWLVEDFWEWETEDKKFRTWKPIVNKILNKMWYSWEKDKKTWIYYIKVLNSQEWEKTTIEQYEPEYYEIFKTLAFIDDKLGIYKDNQDNIKDFKKFRKHWEWVYKQIADILEDAIKEKNFISNKIKLNSISPLEYFFYLNTGQIEKQDILKYTKEIFNIEYFQKYYENKWFKLLEDKEFEILLWEWKANYDGERILFEKYKSYKISLKPSVNNINLILEKVLPFVEKLELRNTKNKQEQEKIRQRYEELKEYLLKKKEELKHTKEAKKHILELKNDITNNLW